MQNSKPWWESKTLWFNVITGLIAIASALNTLVPEKWLPIISAVVAVGNIILRVISQGETITASKSVQISEQG